MKPFVLACALVVMTATRSMAALGDCSQPVSNGGEPVATDCLFILRSVVGLQVCTPECICAPKGTLPATATDALICLHRTTGQSLPLNCPCLFTTSTSSTSSTTTTLLVSAAGCPGRRDVVLYAGTTGIACTSNADCLVGRCDPALGRCVTATDVDTGWTGLAHDSDIADQVRLSFDLVCPGPFQTGAPEPCGICDVAGISPESGNCRCSHDNRLQCSDAFNADPASCGIGVSCVVDADCRVCSQTTTVPCGTDGDCPAGELCLNGLRAPSCVGGQCVGTCQCFHGPPLALSAGNVPSCVVNLFAQDVVGTVNVDSGETALDVELRSRVFIGEDVATPCPACGGVCTVGTVGTPCLSDLDCGVGGVCGSFDSTPRDGLREGTCVFGENHGQACDVDARNQTFPVPGGAGHSLDCFPDSGKNISGRGSRLAFRETTATRSLVAGVTCGFPPFAPEACPCGVCEGDRSLSCTSNADCQSAGQGDCRNDGIGRPRADLCNDAVCTGDKARRCSSNGDCALCTGDGVTPCASNADCTVPGGRCPGGACVLEGVCSPVASVCTGDGTTPCASNGDCALSGGTCVGIDGECTHTGPIDTYCDGALRADGEAYITCNSNADCDQTECGAGVGVGLCGTCSVARVRQCFLDPIVAVGRADPTLPVSAALLCIAPTSRAGFNDTEGLPGPVRRVTQSKVSYTCAHAPGVPYLPGIGGCP